MRKVVIICLAAIFFSCEDRPQTPEIPDDVELTQHQIDSILMKFDFEYENPVLIDSSEIILLPISTEFLEKRKTYSYDGYYSDSYPRYWNILFYNQVSGSTKLLTESKIRISNFHVKHEKPGNILSQKILYIIGDVDYNGDGKLDTSDPDFLFSSNFDGSDLKRVSPQSEDLIYHSIIPNTDRLILRTRRDTDENREFSSEDEEIWYLLDLETNKGPVEIVDEALRKKVKNLYFDQWLRR
ncbi:MAG: hypothetical protein AAF502_06670 [Bacteroidota bacterium]